MPPAPLAILNIGQLVTLAGPKRPRVGVEMRELAVIKDGALIIESGKIAAVGRKSEIESRIPDGATIVDAAKRCITPGLVDAHTHFVFSGNRAEEFEKRC